MKRMILNEQSKVRLTLNGGHQILDEATIPFQIAFDQSVVDAKPTHILVIDITKDVFCSDGERENYDVYGERTIFPLEPINYIQFKKPGIHHLIFILINGLSKTKKRKCLQKSYGRYDSDFWFSSIENNSVVEGQVAYAEVLVEIPKELFSEKSETKFGKAIWNWVNKWYDLEPIDQCEYRKRAIIAFTIQPIIWILGFFIRLIPVVFISTIVMLRSIIAIFFGYQPTRFIPKADVIFWEFLVLFQSGSTKELFTPSEWFGDVIYEYTHYVHQTDFYPYKMLVVKKNASFAYTFCIMGSYYLSIFSLIISI